MWREVTADYYCTTTKMTSRGSSAPVLLHYWLQIECKVFWDSFVFLENNFQDIFQLIFKGQSG